MVKLKYEFSHGQCKTICPYLDSSIKVGSDDCFHCRFYVNAAKSQEDFVIWCLGDEHPLTE